MTARKPMKLARKDVCAMFGVTPQLITRNLKPGAAWDGAACGKLVDVAHPKVVAWAETRGTPVPDSRSLGNGGRAKAAKDSQNVALESYGDLTLNEIFTQHGTEAAFKQFIDALKTIEEINAKRIANAEKEGRTVPKDFIEKFIKSPTERALNQILGELPRALAVVTRDQYEAGANVQEVETAIYKSVAKIVKTALLKYRKVAEDANV